MNERFGLEIFQQPATIKKKLRILFHYDITNLPYLENEVFEHLLQSLANVLNVFEEAHELSSSISIGSDFSNDFVLLNASKVFKAPIVKALEVPVIEIHN